MVAPRLIHTMRVKIAKPDWPLEIRDEVLRTTRLIEEIIDDPRTPKVIVGCQISFSQFVLLTPTDVGDDRNIQGYLIVTDRTQTRHDFKNNDFIVSFLPRGKKEMPFLAKVLEVRPVAQRDSFGLHRISFQKEARAR